MNAALSMSGMMPLLPELVLGVGAMALLMLGAFRGERGVRLIDVASIVLLIAAGVIVLALPQGKLVTFGGSFVVDDFARFLKILAIAGSAAAILMSIDYDRARASGASNIPC
jgi:NADH-quinone oxidoreductase subunit N